MYDTLGIISPVLVSVKVLFQELCSNKVEWDEELKDEEKKRWVSWIDDLKGVREISVPRCVYRVPRDQMNCSLHGFADASLLCHGLHRVRHMGLSPQRCGLPRPELLH